MATVPTTRGVRWNPAHRNEVAAIEDRRIRRELEREEVSEPVLARQLLVVDAGTADAAKAMTAAMRGQFTARVQALAGARSANAPSRSRRRRRAIALIR